MFQVDVRDHFGEFRDRGDSSTHHNNSQPETKSTECTHDTSDNEQPPPILRRRSLNSGNVENHKGLSMVIVGRYYRDMQFFSREFVQSLFGSCLRPFPE